MNGGWDSLYITSGNQTWQLKPPKHEGLNINYSCWFFRHAYKLMEDQWILYKWILIRHHLDMNGYLWESGFSLSHS